MRVLICGDRNLTDEKAIRKFIAILPICSVVIHGDASGADRIAGKAAAERGLGVKPVPAMWDVYGKAAGPIRNRKMLDEEKPDVVVAFHDDLSKSKGTKNMVTQARDRGLLAIVIKPSEVY